MTDDVVAAERSLERLFRLTVSRKMHNFQATVVGAVVTRAGYAVLRCLSDTPGSTMSELAVECSMDPATAARQVKALQDEELVERAPSDEDARVSVVRLTQRGLAVYERIVELRVRHTSDLLAEWAPEDRATLVRLVDRLVDDLRTVPMRHPDTELPAVDDRPQTKGAL